jgi:hypothetical protein
MGSKGYAVFGWLVWQVATRLARRSMAQNKVKLGAAATVALVLIAGVVAARAAAGED